MKLLINSRKITFCLLGILLLNTAFYLFAAKTSEWGGSILDEKNSLISDENMLIKGDFLDERSALIEDSFLDHSQNLLSDENVLISSQGKTSYGSFSSMKQSSYQDVWQNVTQVAFSDAYESSTSDSYYGNLERFFAITLSRNQQEFTNYFTEWESSSSMDFWEWSENKAYEKQRIKLLYDRAIAEFGVGTSLLVIELIIVTASTGPVHAIVLSVLSNAVKFAKVGSVVSAASNGILSAINRDSGELVLANTVEGMASGFMIGSIIGSAKGLKIGNTTYAGSQKIPEGVIRKDGAVLNSKGSLIGKGYFDINGKVSYYSINGVLKDATDGRIVGTTKNLNNINWLYLGEERRPLGYINTKGQIITNDTLSLKTKGLKITSIYGEAADPRRPTYYTTLYAGEHPTIDMSQWKGSNIHHSIEQQVLTKRYPGVFSEDEILRNASNLRGIPKAYNAEVHLSSIRRDWDEVYSNINNYGSV